MGVFVLAVAIAIGRMVHAGVFSEIGRQSFQFCWIE